MRKVILRFLRNKVLEIGKFLARTVLSVLTLCVLLCVIGLGLYGMGSLVMLIPVMTENYGGIFNETDIMSIGMGSIFILVFSVLLVYELPKWLYKWIKENWERAKRETGYNE